MDSFWLFPKNLSKFCLFFSESSYRIGQVQENNYKTTNSELKKKKWNELKFSFFYTNSKRTFQNYYLIKIKKC